MMRVFGMALAVLLALTVFLPRVRGQSLSPTVIASGGGYFTSAGASLSATIGEAVIFTGSSGAALLTQGFQQPDETAVGVEEFANTGSGAIYPNPNSGIFSLTTDNSYSGEATVRVYSLLGQTVYSGTATGAAADKGGAVFHLRLPLLSDGVYWLELLPAGSSAGTRHFLSILH